MTRPIERLAAIEARAEAAADSLPKANVFVSAAREDVTFLAAALREAWAEIDAMRAVLERVEWAGAHDDPYCSSCGAGAALGHATNCALAACLRGAK